MGAAAEGATREIQRRVTSPDTSAGASERHSSTSDWTGDPDEFV